VQTRSTDYISLADMDKAAKASVPRASYTGQSKCWHGAIKVGSKLVWKCGHTHHNRDQGGWTHGTAASACARSALKVALKSEAEIEQMKRDVRATAQGMTRVRWNIDYELSVRDEIRAALNL